MVPLSPLVENDQWLTLGPWKVAKVHLKQFSRPNCLGLGALIRPMAGAPCPSRTSDKQFTGPLGSHFFACALRMTNRPNASPTQSYLVIYIRYVSFHTKCQQLPTRDREFGSRMRGTRCVSKLSSEMCLSLLQCLSGGACLFLFCEQFLFLSFPSCLYI